MKTITYDDTQWQLVPKEPTVEQQDAMEDAYYESGDATKAYKAGLSAAPTPPAQPATGRKLTEERIAAMARVNYWHSSTTTMTAYREGVRDAESSHGITEP